MRSGERVSVAISEKQNVEKNLSDLLMASFFILTIIQNTPSAIKAYLNLKKHNERFQSVVV